MLLRTFGNKFPVCPLGSEITSFKCFMGFKYSRLLIYLEGLRTYSSTEREGEGGGGAVEMQIGPRKIITLSWCVFHKLH